MFLQDRFEFILGILHPYGFIAALILTAMGVGLHIYAKVRPLLPLYFVLSFFFALFCAFLVGYVFYQISNGPDPFFTSLFMFGLIALPVAFLLLIGANSGKGFRLDMFFGIASLILLPLGAALVTQVFVAIQSFLWRMIF